MPNEVTIRVNAETGKTTEAFQKTNAELKTLKRESVDTSTRLKDMTNRLGAIALGTIGASFGFRQMTTTLNNMRQTAALTEVIVGQLGEGAVKNFEEMQKQFDEAGKEFGFTATQLEGAFGIISRESRSSKVGIDDLRFAMALARTAGISLAEAAKIVGQAMLGNVEPLRAITGELGSLEDIQQRVIDSGQEATTVWQKMGAELTNTSEGVAGLVASLLELQSRNDETFGEGVVKAFTFRTAIDGLRDSVGLLRRDFGLLPEAVRDALTFRTAIDGAKQGFGELRDLITGGSGDSLPPGIHGPPIPDNLQSGGGDSLWGRIKREAGAAWKDAIRPFGGLGSDLLPNFKLAPGPGMNGGSGAAAFQLPPVPVAGPQEVMRDAARLQELDALRDYTHVLRSVVGASGRPSDAQIRQAREIMNDAARERTRIVNKFEKSPGAIQSAAMQGGGLEKTGLFSDALAGSINITINGNVDNEQTARELARRIKDLIQEDNRRGIGF